MTCRVIDVKSPQLPEWELKRKEEVTKWREQMGLKSEYLDGEPDIPTSRRSKKKKVPGTHQDRILESIRLAVDDDNQAMLFTLPESDSQLAIDTIWKVSAYITIFPLEVLADTHSTLQMLAMPPSGQLTASLESTAIQGPTRSKLRRISLKLVLQYDKMPAALFLKNVECPDRETRGAGGFADVYCGEYAGAKVALKCLRVYLMSSEVQKAKLKRVSHRFANVHYALSLI